MIEINFKSVKEMEKFLNYLDTLEINFDVETYDRKREAETVKELFLDDTLSNPTITNLIIREGNKFISKILFGIWLEDKEEILDKLFYYNDDTLDKYKQFFEECFTIPWEEKEKEKKKINLEYELKIHEIEKEIEKIKRQKFKEIKELDEKYSKKSELNMKRD